MSGSYGYSMGASELFSGVEVSVGQMQGEVVRLGESQRRLTESLESLLLQMDQLRAAVAGESRRAAQYWDLLLEIADRCFAATDGSLEWIRQHLCAGFARLGYRFYGVCGEKISHLEEYEVVGRAPASEQQGPGALPLPEEGASPRSSSSPAWEVVQTLKIGLRNSQGAIVRRAKVLIGAAKTFDPQTRKGDSPCR